MLAWPWTHIFGTSESGLRSLSALIGTATIPVAYWAGPRGCVAASRSEAAALAATNPYLLWWSQEAQAYALLVLAGGATFALFCRALRERGSNARLAYWALAAALALATHYFALFVVLPQAVWLVARHRGRAAIAVGGVAVAGAALLPLALRQRATGNAAWITDFPRTERIRQTVDAFFVSDIGPLSLRHRLLIPELLLVAVAVVLLVVRGGARERRGAGVALVVGGCGLLIPLVLSVVHVDYFFHRNLVAAWIPLAVVPTAGFAVGGGRLGISAALAAVCLVGVIGIATVDLEPRLQRARTGGGQLRSSLRAASPGS